MKSKMSNYELQQLIRSYGHSYVQYYQVRSRLKKLLSLKRSCIIKEIRQLSSSKASQAEREAYLSEDYKTYVEHLLEVQYGADRAKVEFECGKLLLGARQSIQKWFRE